MTLSLSLYLQPTLKKFLQTKIKTQIEFFAAETPNPQPHNDHSLNPKILPQNHSQTKEEEHMESAK